jgi:hypothetical protein
MPRLILLLAVIAVVYLLFRRAQSVPPHKRRAEFMKLGLGVAVLVVVGLTLTGKMHWLGAAITGLLVVLRQSLPSLIRLFPMLAAMRGSSSPSQGQSSTVETPVLRMQLDHDSGDLQGEVLKGDYQGWRLADMDRQQLEELVVYCQGQDSDSMQLLGSYLQQRFPGEAPSGQQQYNSDSGGNISRKEALAVLGLEDGASDEDIVAAHRKLMQKLHPDRGGNDYLAAKVNQAKDLLLG